MTATDTLVAALQAHGIPAQSMPAFGPFEILIEMHAGDEVAVESLDGVRWSMRLLMVDVEPIRVADDLEAEEVPGRFLAEFDGMFDAT